jgi:hypothetical protein
VSRFVEKGYNFTIVTRSIVRLIVARCCDMGYDDLIGGLSIFFPAGVLDSRENLCVAAQIGFWHEVEIIEDYNNQWVTANHI